MHFLRSIITVAGLLAAAVAQQQVVAPQFNFVPSAITAGQIYTLSWEGGNGNPVDISLMQGDPNALQDMGIIASKLQGTTFNWVTNTTLVNGQKYALMITQGEGFSISSAFAISGGKAAVPTTTMVSTTAAPSTMLTSMSPSAPPASSTISGIPKTVSASPKASAAAASPSDLSPVDRDRKKLTIGGIVGVVIGGVAILTMCCILGMFVVVKKILDKKAAAAQAANGGMPREHGDEEDSSTNLRDAGAVAGAAPATVAQMSQAGVAKQMQPHYRKRSGSGAGSEASNYSTNLSSPDTLVGTPQRRMEVDDGEGNRQVPPVSSPLRSNPTSYAQQQQQAPVYPNGPAPGQQHQQQPYYPSTVPVQYDEHWVQRQAYQVHPAANVSQGQQGRISAMQPHYTAEIPVPGHKPRSDSTTSTLGKERRWSPQSPTLGPSKLRTQFDAHGQ